MGVTDPQPTCNSQLHTELAFYKSALDAHAIVAITDRSGRITYVNEKFCEISQYSRDELIGRDHRILNSGMHPKSFFTEMYAAIARGRTWRGEIRNRAKDGSLYWVDTTIVPMLDEHRNVISFVAIRQDITARKHAEQELVAAKEAAEAANRAKDEFLANISHEIRTPLAAILGFTEVLAEPDLTESERREHVARVRRNGEHLLSLISNLLDMSKIEADRMPVEAVPTNLQTIVCDVESMMRAIALAKGLALIVQSEAGVPQSIVSDPLRLRQILINLVSNAIKFTPRGEVRLLIGTDRSTTDQLKVWFEVSDTGIGIPPEKLKTLFKPFSQVDSSTTRRFGGTGIGLYISRRLATLLGGFIEVESVPNVGSTFTLRLNDVADVSSPGREARAATSERPEETATLRGLRILLAEDGEDNQRLFTHWLTRAGAEVTAVMNGQDACDALSATQPGQQTFHIVLMDMQMPVMDGYQATRALRDMGLRIPIIALTAHASPGDREKCLAAGCNEYLSKPVPRCRLIGMCAHNADSLRAAA